MDIEALTDQFFQLGTTQDWEGMAAMFAKGAVVSQPGAGELGVDQLVLNLGGLSKAGIRTSYENVRRVVGADSVAEQHDVRLTRPDGVEVLLDVCVVMRFGADGLLTRVDEYFDPTAVAPLMA